MSDKKAGVDSTGDGNYDYYRADVVNANDYYPGGMMMPNRKYAADDSYRYGFNGKENDNEVKGEGNQQDYGMRVYDPRLGKFLSVDPIADDFPFYSPYHFAGNTPIEAFDLDGLEPAYSFTDDKGRLISRPAGDNLRRRVPEEERKYLPVGSGPNDNGQGVSMLLNLTPGIGTAKGLYEGITGKDVITDEKLTTTDRILGVVPYVRPIKQLKNAKTIAKVENTASTASKTDNVLAKGAKTTDNSLVKSDKVQKAEDKLKTAAAGTSSKNQTDFVVNSKGEAVAIPDGAKGPSSPNKGSGMSYQGGSGGKGMSKNTTGVRIMDANNTQGRRVNYMNRSGQTVDPVSGKTISNKDPRGHIPYKE